jgi:putative hydrolase of the HAD superfamily
MATLPNRPEAIVFDLWYTLVCPEHHRPQGVRSSTAIPALLQLDPSRFASFWEAQLPTMYSDPRPLREYIAEYLFTLGRKLNEAETGAFEGIWAAHDTALSLPRPQVLDALSRLVDADIRLALLSNAHEREIRHWSESPLSSYFDAVSFSCHIGCAKPQPSAYVHILEALRVKPEKAIYVGDGASNELQGARDAGFGAVVFMRGLLAEVGIRESEYLELAGQANVAVDSIAELANLLTEKDGPIQFGRLTSGRNRRAKARG